MAGSEVLLALSNMHACSWAAAAVPRWINWLHLGGVGEIQRTVCA
jgi:hypothetical protein